MKRFAVVIFVVGVVFSFGYSQYHSGVSVETILKTDTTAIGQHITYPDFQNDEVTIAKVTIPPGVSTGWHKHGFPVFAYVVQGMLSVELESGKTLQFMEHSCFAEVIGTMHNGKNTGNENVVLIAFYMGEKGKQLSVPQAK